MVARRSGNLFIVGVARLLFDETALFWRILQTLLLGYAVEHSNAKMATAFFLFCYTVFSELVRRKDNNKKHEEVAQYVLSAVDIETATLNKHNVCEYFGMSLQHSRNGATPAVTNVILQSGKSLLFVTSEVRCQSSERDCQHDAHYALLLARRIPRN